MVIYACITNWVIMTKVARFITWKATYYTRKQCDIYALMYDNEILRLHHKAGIY